MARSMASSTHVARSRARGRGVSGASTECQRLCSDPARFGGVKAEGGKRAKREAAAKMQERHYHVQDPAQVKFKGDGIGDEETAGRLDDAIEQQDQEADCRAIA